MLHLCFLLVLGYGSNRVGLKPTMTLEAVPDDGDVYFQGASDAAVDPDGSIYVLDARSAAIFVWDKSGAYKTHFGKAGQGPGEFSFRGNSGGSVSATEKRIYVFDSGTKVVSVFDKNRQFLFNKPLAVTNGRVDMFRVVDDERFLVLNSSWFSETPYRLLALYNAEGKLLKELENIKDETWRYGSDGGQRRVVLYPYATTMVAEYNEATQRVLVGDSAFPTLNLIDVEGAKLKKIDLKMTRRELTKEDREEWNSQEWFKTQTFFKVEFPDRKSYYNRVAPLEDGGALVFLISVLYNRCEGVLVDKNGATTARFTFDLGEGGSLFSSRGKVIAVQLDEEEEYTVRFLKPVAGQGG